MQAKHMAYEPTKICSHRSLSELVIVLIFQMRCQNWRLLNINYIYVFALSGYAKNVREFKIF